MKSAEDDRELQNLRDLLLKKSEEIMFLKRRNTDLESGVRTRDDEIRRLKRELDERDKTIKGLRHSRVGRGRSEGGLGSFTGLGPRTEVDWGVKQT